MYIHDERSHERLAAHEVERLSHVHPFAIDVNDKLIAIWSNFVLS